jgi:hypothetical protein
MTHRSVEKDTKAQVKYKKEMLKRLDSDKTLIKKLMNVLELNIMASPKRDQLVIDSAESQAIPTPSVNKLYNRLNEDSRRDLRSKESVYVRKNNQLLDPIRTYKRYHVSPLALNTVKPSESKGYLKV